MDQIMSMVYFSVLTHDEYFDSGSFDAPIKQKLDQWFSF